MNYIKWNSGILPPPKFPATAYTSHTMSTSYYDPNEELELSTSGNLPHWNQSGKIQFITFRLGDSLPKSRITELNNLRATFLANNPQPWNMATTQEYWKLTGPVESRLLDNGYGSCIFKNQEIRTILSDCLQYLNGKDYNLIAYVIMPNHVHLLIKTYEIGKKLSAIMHSIKSFSANKINKLINNRSGSLWMKEYFDRIIRSETHLNSCINYIISNPRLLNPGEYELFINPKYLRQDAASPR